ncbi:hypothetical protein [Clostridium manihotivorum]|uniref:Uncharacterized protein n=1 Tax=Clostridium manihotivorum TaxID=2320868 RepID=A0A410DYL5_9CLOT|nr:hypothetical protein [Clostridium manihotivorum]QAA34165.1 hypothetical protein C1I91_22430 [Clostridium manihotivorum]
MNNGQEKFLNFILERVQEDKLEEAKVMLLENFRKQDEDTFTQQDIMEFIPKMLAILKPEKIAEVQTVMNQFSSNTNH